MKTITAVGISVALAAPFLALSGCAMSPARVAQLPTDELCVDLAETLVRGGPASEGGMQIPVQRSAIEAALSARGASCADNEPEYLHIAELRLQNQAVASANLANALMGAAASY